ncbi:MAG: hypothetical protein WCA11_19235 [Terracidiphilus sp.]
MKKNISIYAFMLLTLALFGSTAANAMVLVPAPEVDPGCAVGSLTLLCGALAILRVKYKS